MVDRKDTPMVEPESSTRMEEDRSDDDETWDEPDADIEIQIICLFCPQTFKTMAVTLEHCRVVHNFNLMHLKAKFDMDCYSYLCMVNYIRKEHTSPETLNSLTEPPWLKEVYLCPVIEDDAWLMYDFEGLELPSTGSNPLEPAGEELENAMINIKHENDFVTISESSFSYLQKTIRFYAEEIQKKDAMLAAATAQIDEMKTVAQKLFAGDLSLEEKDLEKRILALRLSDDNAYFKTYSHFGIHLEMLSDRIRMLSFREAILLNHSTFANKTVLDVGCGSGILSLFAASADATKVYGVDQSEIIFYANDIVRENNLCPKIELIHGKIEDVTLPVDKVDIIVSEWLGYFLLFEGMLDSVLSARDRFLKANGRILPDRCSLYIAGVADPENYEKMVKFWNNVYGYKMSCLAKETLQEAAILEVAPDLVATTSAMIFELNLYIHDVKNTNFTSEFTLESFVKGELTALCGYFVANFNLPHEITFSTSPNHPKTHWKQTVFFLPTPIPVQKGTVLKGQIECKRKIEDNRSLIITIEIEGQKNVYMLG